MKFFKLTIKKNKLFPFLLAFSLFLILVFFLKNFLIEYLIEKKIKSINHKYSLNISYDQLQLIGYNKIRFSKLQVKNEDLSLLKSNELIFKINVLTTLIGKTRIKSLKIDSIELNLQKDSTGCSYHITVNKQKKDSILYTHSHNYRTKFQSLFRVIEGILPSEMSVKYFSLNVDYLGEKSYFETEKVKLKNNKLIQIFSAATPEKKSTIRVIYEYQPSKHRIIAQTELLSGQAFEIPLLLKKINLSVSGKVAFFTIRLRQFAAGTDVIEGNLKFAKARIHHFRISSDTLKINKLGLTFRVYVKNKYLELDSNSFVSLNDFKINLYTLYDQTKGKRVVLGFKIPVSDVDLLIRSVPAGIFQVLDGFQASGKIAYRLMIDVDLNNPDSLKFYNKLYRYNFQVKNFGKLNTQRLLQEFEYTAYKQERPVRTFYVGPSNPFFIPFEQIPERLKFAVLCSEDGAFFYHAGFIEDAIKEAIITNLKYRRFVRGGSTITMQFVKNMFLNSRKVLTRKVEEIIITWLIENYRLLSKERIFEIYINFIEWGPGIYGLGEACDFYFQKRPEYLTLDEAVYLAGIIPRPASFMWVFDHQGNLKNYFISHCRFVAGRMLKKEAISQEEFDNFIANVHLTGRAKDFLKIDSVQTDTIITDF